MAPDVPNCYKHVWPGCGQHRSLMDFAPPYSSSARCHELKGDKAGIFSIDLDHPYRLLFRPDHDPLPQRSEGGIDWSQVIAIVILEIEDTHE